VALDQWQTKIELTVMLLDLRGRVSERKFRLLSVALCRRAHDSMADERSSRAVEVAERFADGLAAPDELAAASEKARRAYSEAEAHAKVLKVGRRSDVDGPAEAACHAAAAAYYASHWPPRSAWELPGDPVDVSTQVSCVTACLAMVEAGGGREVNNELWNAARLAEWRDQVPLFNCIFGDSYLPVKFAKAWRTPPVIRLAEEAYHGHSFEILPVLGDALEEAGCLDREILDHCRGEHPHARGCWVLDGVLGRT
jgi:hypothetical protein